MLDFIKEVVEEEWEFQLRWLVAEVWNIHEVRLERAVWVITEEREVWEAHPKMIKTLLELYPLLHPRKITWYTMDPWSPE